MAPELNIVEESKLDEAINDLNRLLATLDEQGLQVPALHIANAIDSLERIAD